MNNKITSGLILVLNGFKKAARFKRYTLSILLGLLFALGSPVQFAFADHVHEDENAIFLLTNDMLKQIDRLINAQENNKQNQVQKITDSILKRKMKLVELLIKHPEKAAKHLLPDEIIDQLPQEIKELLEVSVDTQGEMTTTIAYFKNGSTQTFYSLQDANDPTKTFELHFADNPINVPSGSTIKVHGKKIDNHILLEANGTTTTTTTQVAATNVAGDQKTIVIPINFQNSALACSDAMISSIFFTGTSSLKNYYAESSFNQINMVGDVASRVTIPYNSTDACNYSAWSNAADSAVTAAGINLSNYTRKVYEFPASSCGYIGLGTIGGNPSKSWLFQCDWPDVAAHEYGHNLGWHHASTGSLSAAQDEYGDTSCIMGYSGVGLRQPNTVHKVESGWIPSARVQTVTTPGTYTIYNSENGNTTNFQAIKIPKADTNENYYLSYRYPTGFDAGLGGGYAMKTNIHRWNGLSGTKTYLLTALDNGTTFSDPTNGIAITQLSHDTNVSVVSVTFAQALCSMNNPVVTISPSNSGGSKGQTLSYGVSVTNANSPACANSTILLSSVVPSDWTGSFSPATLTLASGSLGASTFNVTSPATALSGNYAIAATASDSSDLSKTTTVNATYSILSDTTPPVVSFISPVNGESISGRETIAVSATDNVGVKKVEFYIDNVLFKTDTSSPFNYAWSTKPVANGSHVLTAKAYDALSNVGLASITVYKNAGALRTSAK